MRLVILPMSLLLMSSLLLLICSTKYPNRNHEIEIFSPVSGKTLDEKAVALPSYFMGNTTLLLLSYVQNVQFDIDRWLIGVVLLDAEGKVVYFFDRGFSVSALNELRGKISQLPD